MIARASTGRLAAYGILGFPLAMAALPIYVHVPKFYAETIGLSLATIGTVLLATRALDALQDPLLGWWSDRRRAAPGGRWLFVAVGAPLLALGMIGLFSPPAWSGAALTAWLVANLVLVYTAYSLVTVSYQAHGAEIATGAGERTRVTAWREGFGLAGVLVAAALPEILARQSGSRAGFAQFAMVFAPLVLVGALAAIVGSPRAAPGVARDATLRTLWLPLGNARFRWLLAAFMASGIAAAIPATLVLFYIEDIVRRPNLAALFLATYFAAGALGLPGWVWLSRRIGKARAWLCGMGLAIGAFVWAYFLGPGDVKSFAVICVVSGVALGADLALPPSMLADAIDDDEARGLVRREGSYFGLWNLATKLNLALAAGAALPLLEALGYLAGHINGPRELAALAGVYALVPCVLKAGAAAILWNSPFVNGEER